MKVNELPCIHFMMQVRDDHDSFILSPRETEHQGSGGAFFVPISEKGTFFSAYRFQFAIYLGQGEFYKSEGKKVLFDGVALAMRQHRLVLTFFPSQFKDPLLLSLSWLPLPYLLRDGDEFVTPMLRKVPRVRKVRYGGKFEHKDFRHFFVELEPEQPGIFDELLDRFKISVVGCDPFTRYRYRRKN